MVINEPGKKTDQTLLPVLGKANIVEDIQQLKDILASLKSIEKQSEILLSKLEKDGLS